MKIANIKLSGIFNSSQAIKNINGLRDKSHKFPCMQGGEIKTGDTYIKKVSNTGDRRKEPSL